MSSRALGHGLGISSSISKSIISAVATAGPRSHLDVPHGSLQIIELGVCKGIGRRTLLRLTRWKKRSQQYFLFFLGQGVVVDLEILMLLRRLFGRTILRGGHGEKVGMIFVSCYGYEMRKGSRRWFRLAVLLDVTLTFSTNNRIASRIMF